MRGFTRAAGIAALVLACAACSHGGARVDAHGNVKKAGDVSVFDLQEHECVVPPNNVSVEISHVRVVPCSQPHTQEVTGRVPPYPTSNDVYPGDTALKDYANGACQKAFASYVGISYGDSKYYYTYLFPSIRGWQSKQADKDIVCLVTTTGQELTGTVAGKKQ